MDYEFYLRENVINSKTREPYGVKGDKVKFIADHDNCYIVETEKKCSVWRCYLFPFKRKNRKRSNK